MLLRLSLLLGLCILAPTCVLGATVLRLGNATIALDGKGRVVSLRAADGHEYAPPGAPPAFELATDAGTFRPTAVARSGSTLAVTFGKAGRMRLAIAEGKGFAVLKVVQLTAPGTVERLQLFCLPVKGPQTTGDVINACYDARFATAVMATEVNVRPRLLTARGGGSGDNKDCTHRFERSPAARARRRHASPPPAGAKMVSGGAWLGGALRNRWT